MEIILLQKASGSWICDSKLLNLLGISAIASVEEGLCGDVVLTTEQLGTILVLAHLVVYYSSYESEWQLIFQKGLAWLTSNSSFNVSAKVIQAQNIFSVNGIIVTI
jgi:hypothetical protein